MTIRCRQCGADWGQGEFTASCTTCGGGALTIPCGICEGSCGATWQRAVADSNDRRLAHWNGGCLFPPEEQQRRLVAYVERMRAQRDALPAAPPPVAAAPPSVAAPPPRPRVTRPAPRDTEVARWLAAASPPEVGRLRAHLLAGFERVATTWGHFKESLGVDVHDRWDDYDLAKGNARFATVVWVTLRARDVTVDATPAELLDAAARILHEAPEDPDYDPPRPSLGELVAMVEAVWKDGLA